MGHAIFLILHFLALLFGVAGLLLTIPLHLIYSATKSKSEPEQKPEEPTPKTHVRCPDCRELVRADARLCKHCGTALSPQNM